jgi:small-conductance mechanosensitive channel
MSSAASFQLPQSKMGLGSDHSDLIVFFVRYFRIVAMVFVVWVIGYFNFSLSWVLLAVFLYLLREKKRSARTLKSEMIKVY